MAGAMPGICDGRVVIVTGAGRGLGRAHALEFARQGARVVVNDLGVERDGGGRSSEVAEQVVAEIRSSGGEAVAHADDIATDEGARSLIDTAVETFGRLDVLVNNAGFLRDRLLINPGEDEWGAAGEAVARWHLTGQSLPLRCAGRHWRAEAKAGRSADARIINTSSGAGL